MRAAVITLGSRGGDWRPRPRARRSGTSARGTPAWPAGSAERLPPAVATCWSSWRLKLLSTLLLELNLLDQLGLLGQLELDPPEHLLMKKLASGLVDAFLAYFAPKEFSQHRPPPRVRLFAHN